jgi:hypothetical protein
MDIVPFHNPRLAPYAIAALKAIQTSGRPAGLAVAIENVLDDLSDLSADF